MENLNNIFHHILFLIKVQWLDRSQTSAYLVGMSLQTAVFCYTLFNMHHALESRTLMIMMVQCCLFTTLPITLLAAMSSVSNEFRYMTIKNVLLSNIGIFRLIFIRSAANSVICAPAILFLALVTFVLSSQPSLLRFFVVIICLFSYLIIVGVHCSLLLNVLGDPHISYSWITPIYVSLGLGILPVPYKNEIERIFPSYWIKLMAREDMGTAEGLLWFIATSSLSTVILCIALKVVLNRRINQKLIAGRVSS